ncbi:hypothetical protein [Bacillus thuringiensis]|uniref:hypothetical protein n=1 Tax=Bacillus thuringiensis TaxID=1428 RepID=UPI0009BE9973|nr:hypothetical protein [Bacillus thuringiensis]
MKTEEGFKPVVVGKTTTQKTILHIIGANESVTLTPIGVPPAFRKKTTLRKSELKNQKIYHYSKTHTVSFFIQKIIQHNINCVVLGVIININLGV